MPQATTSSTSIPFGTYLRIGYRQNGSTSPYTYINHYPSYDELPYVFTLPSSGEWEIEYTVVCNQCTGNAKYSDPETTIVTV